MQFLLDNWAIVLPLVGAILVALSGSFPALKPFVDLLTKPGGPLPYDPNNPYYIPPAPIPSPTPTPTPNPNPTPTPNPTLLAALQAAIYLINHFKGANNPKGEQTARDAAKQLLDAEITKP